jgi:hypothetical protein
LSLGKLNDSRAEEPLINALQDEDIFVRASAAESLGELKNPRAVEPLIRALKDIDNHVRYRAAIALGELGDTKAVGPLNQVLKENDSELQDAASEALDRIDAIRLSTSDGSLQGSILQNVSEKATSNNMRVIKLSNIQTIWLYGNQDLGFRMKYLDGWLKKEADPNNAGLIVGFLAPGEDLNDPNPQNYLVVQYEELPQVLTVDQYTQASLDSVRIAHPDFRILSDQKITISSLPGRRLEYTINQGSYQVLQEFVIKDQSAYLLTFNALANQYPKLEGDATKIISSFEFF